MSFTVPSTWKFFSSQGNGNSMTFTLPGHTAKEPKYVIISRIPPVYDTRRKTWSVPEYRIRVYFGVLDADGAPDPTKTAIDATCRSTVASNGAAAAPSTVAAFLAIVDQADFVSAAYGSQEFPTVSAV